MDDTAVGMCLMCALGCWPFSTWGRSSSLVDRPGKVAGLSG
ncbi:hypothetical protein MIZ03_3058 [Rhodoferax lithotrophicus]|uniref:Uncharacterized protein n=1 Tax=Rhodoferax lithotrophicus TaxID=2798804 RepID=A0ABN6DBC4_9BURK|nr:hypothetical protein MIZ03_3058 [Rhodoferax sp. MIZ03]